MPRDYAHRGKPTKRRNTRSKSSNSKGNGRNQAPESNRKLLVPALFIGAIVIAFVAGLWKLKTITPPVAEQPAETAKPAPKTEPKSENKDPLPPKPTEKWKYIEDLENKVVEVDVPEQPESQGPYLMQCGSFRAQSQAEELRARIAFQGLESQVRASDGKNGRWYRVILGPYERKRKAEKDRHSLQRANINYCKIWKWNL